jgi:RNA polymerase sigma factor (sigma-70 family)
MADRADSFPDPQPPAAGQPVAGAGFIDQLFREHNAQLVNFLRLRLHNDAEAREIAQEAYVRLLQLRNPGTVSFLRAYLFKIAANLAVDRLRDRQRFDPGLREWGPEADGVADPFDVERSMLAAEDYALFMQCLDELTPKCRESFVLHRLKKLSTQQIAQRLGITPRMVRKHVSRALLYCRYRLDGLSAEQATERLMYD